MGGLDEYEFASVQFELAWPLAVTLRRECPSIQIDGLQLKGERGVFPRVSCIRRSVAADIVPFHLAGPRPCRIAGECRVLVDRPDPWPSSAVTLATLLRTSSIHVLR